MAFGTDCESHCPWEGHVMCEVTARDFGNPETKKERQA